MRTLLILILLSQVLSGRDHVLIIGGGYSPAGNQVSLERNVIFFEKLRAEKMAANTPCDLYFADGTSPNPDLQFQLEGVDVPRANRLMAGLFGSEDNLENEYRNNSLQGVRGASSPEELERWFKEEGPKLQKGDRLILYVTAHGGRSGNKDNKFNTKIWMWDRRTIDAARVAGWIEELPEGVSVMTVMVQCYSGGFSHLVFGKNDAGEQATGRRICGFFATVHDREAAGCTPDVNEANYDEFSSHFWAALRGKTRMDKEVTAGDYDGDGMVSFEEAHAYAILVSRNIDIPVKTSDAFLRVHGELRSEKKSDLLGYATPYSEILAKGGPVEKALLEGLSRQLNLAGESRGAEMKNKVEELSKEVKELEQKKKEQKKKLDGARNKIAGALRNRWPALENRHSPGAVSLLSDPRLSGEFVSAVEAHPEFAKWDGLRRERKKLEDDELALSKRYATHRRFMRAFENVAYAANLAAVASPAIQERYRQLVEDERGTLGAGRDE